MSQMSAKMPQQNNTNKPAQQDSVAASRLTMPPKARPSIEAQPRLARLALLLIALAVALSCEQPGASCSPSSLPSELRHQRHSREPIKRTKRALYELPDGAELLVSQGSGRAIRTSFTCDGLGYGYYADQDNDCRIFHVCQSFKMSDGSLYNNHWSFVCGNQTVFNQVTLTCSHPDDSVPCENAKDFYHVNDYFGDLQAPSVRDSDLSQAQELVSRAYGSRL